jgi:hypothetical protein
MEEIVVEPFADGWAVKTSGVVNEMVFRSGREAEGAARSLAFRLAALGDPIRLELRLRSAQPPVAFVCLPPIGAGKPIMVPTPTGIETTPPQGRDPDAARAGAAASSADVLRHSAG